MPRFTAAMVTTLVLAGASVVFLVPRVAHADPESDAKDLFERGRDMRSKGDCGNAVPLFRKAYGVFPKGLGSLRNIAECEEQIGHFASSRRAWLDLRRALIALPAPDPKYDGWDKDAQDAAARLAPKVATVFVDVTVRSPEGEAPATDKSGVELIVNGESLGTTLVGTPLERDPGDYTIRVQAPDAKPVDANVSLAAGDSKHMRLILIREPPQTSTPVDEHAVDEHATRRTVGWTLLGVGGAALVGGVVTVILRGSAIGDLDSACNVNACPRSQQSNVDSIESRGKTMSTLTSILLPVGGVMAVGGIALVLTSRPSASTGSVFVAPSVGGLRVGGAF